LKQIRDATKPCFFDPRVSAQQNLAFLPSHPKRMRLAPSLAASFWNNVGAGMVIGGMGGRIFLEKLAGAWTKISMA
jgi:hypothetical protein